MEEKKKQKIKVKQPPWKKPTEGRSCGLKVENSLKKGVLEDLIPNEGNLLRWYTCGPTVYDAAHLGHARNYLTFDVIRRIVGDYFGYDNFYCMNITDIDDKIIIKARRVYLFGEYAKVTHRLEANVIADLDEAWTNHIEDLIKKLGYNKADRNENKRSKKELDAEEDLLQIKLKLAEEYHTNLKKAAPGSDATKYVQEAEDPLSVLLDNRLGKTLDSELVKKLCQEQAQKYEIEYFEDMKALGIAMPDVIVRVSECIPQVIEMVETIIKNGFGYVSEGSVYFSTTKFHNTPGRSYAKLKPSARNNKKLLSEGEGALGATGDREYSSDFALWKKSKPGEPSWSSPWGQGRPGWHIECSAMASAILGSVMDIHCGGVDLKFPHHDNELAQSEAYFGKYQWVNYFLHSGHLDIDGLKMSKSLKNFITIRDAFNLGHTPRQIRFYFLLHTWNKGMNYQREGTMVEVHTKEKTITEFLIKAKQLKLEHSKIFSTESWNNKDKELHNHLLEIQSLVQSDLKNNFDTKSALNHLIELISLTNTYMLEKNQRKALLVTKVATYLKRMLDIFGLDFTGTSSQNQGGSVEDIVDPYVRTIANFRKKVREGAKTKQNTDYFIKLCDEIRDETMPHLNIKIVDDSEFDFYFVDKEQLLEEIAKKKADETKNFIKKKQNTLNAKEKELTKWEDFQLSPSDLIKKKFNVLVESETNIPEEDLNGKKVSNQNKKRISTEWKKQIENNQKFQAELEKNETFFEDLKSVVAQLREELAQLIG